MTIRNLKIVALLFLALAAACSTGSNQKLGNEIIEKIEQFKTHEKRLPETLDEIGVPVSESGPIYYRRVGEDRYQLWYGTALGESVTYDSDRKDWRP